MKDDTSQLCVNNINFNVKSVFSNESAETLNQKMKRLIINENILPKKLAKKKIAHLQNDSAVTIIFV